MMDTASLNKVHVNTLGQDCSDVHLDAPPRHVVKSRSRTPQHHTVKTPRHSNSPGKPASSNKQGSHPKTSYNYTKSLHYRARPRVWLRRSVSVLANNGQREKLTPTLTKQKKFITSGCTGKRCVIYSTNPYYTNPDGSTFFAYVPRSVLYGAHHKPVTRLRGAVPPPHSNPHKVRRRTIEAHDYRPELAQITGNPTADIVHGPGARMWEYTSLDGGRFISGAETPASYWSHGRKLGTGYTTGVFRPGQKFYDIGGQTIKTPIRLDTDPEVASGSKGTGTASWKLGYVPDHGHKVWTWMLEKMNVAGHTFAGNIS